ncbi:MAG: MotA/TolQ/ExbB proton channel family protein [Planctomycetaceae bacterium]|nr:MotA/TolQ/ExbB proton channel family protein [Planctomycetaceae bacterium]
MNDKEQATAKRFRLWMVICLTLIAGGMLSGSWGANSSIYAQDEPVAEVEEEPDADVESADKEEQTNETDDDEVPTEQSFLAWMIKASGIFGAILLALSFVMVALVMMNVLQVKRDIFIPSDFVNAYKEKLDAKDYKGAYDLCKADDSLVARVLAVGMSRLDRGYAAAIEGMQELGEEENMNYEHRLSYLALISSVAPMIGLMGTVYGMILSFQKIATSTVAPKPAELADGISTALFTTLEGLAVAIPAMVAYSILRNRVSRYMLEVGMVSEGLMGRLPIGKPQA